MKSAKRRRAGVNLNELDRVLDGAGQAPLSEADCRQTHERLACPGGDAGAVTQSAWPLAPFPATLKVD